MGIEDITQNRKEIIKEWFVNDVDSFRRPKKLMTKIGHLIGFIDQQQKEIEELKKQNTLLIESTHEYGTLKEAGKILYAENTKLKEKNEQLNQLFINEIAEVVRLKEKIKELKKNVTDRIDYLKERQANYDSVGNTKLSNQYFIKSRELITVLIDLDN